ncbi:hypothetical protein M427DRAFT_59623, partial [Gonapodya prolifera JEL478]
MKLLPLEVQEIIFALCDPASAWSLSRVSRQLHSLSLRPSTRAKFILSQAQSLSGDPIVFVTKEPSEETRESWGHSWGDDPFNPSRERHF